MATVYRDCGRVANDGVVPDLVAVERCIDSRVKFDGSGETGLRSSARICKRQGYTMAVGQVSQVVLIVLADARV
jgi:hypothetical protein